MMQPAGRPTPAAQATPPVTALPVNAGDVKPATHPANAPTPRYQHAPAPLSSSGLRVFRTTVPGRPMARGRPGRRSPCRDATASRSRRRPPSVPTRVVPKNDVVEGER